VKLSYQPGLGIERVQGWFFCLIQNRSIAMLGIVRATLDKVPGTKSLGFNLNQIEPWIGPFLTLKKTLFPKVQWVCLKAWGPIWGFDVKNVWLIMRGLG